MRFISLLVLSTALFAETDFITGQAARLVIGQPTFTAQEYDASDSIVGAVGGLAYVNDMLFVADSNRLSALPVNHRALIYKNLSQQLPGPLDELPVGERCPVCVGLADVVLGQPGFDVEQDDLLQPPGQNTMRTPIGIASDGIRVAIADTDNNRVLIWNSIPTDNGQPADVVLGQEDFNSAVPKNPTAQSLKGPQGVWFQDGRLFVADTYNNRVLIWNTIPTQNYQSADIVLGQKDFTSYVEPDLQQADYDPRATTLLTPVSVTSDGQRLFVSDLGHSRVLIWNSIPTQNQAPADLVVGQPDLESAFANNSPELCEVIGYNEEEDLDIYPTRCAATMDFPRYALSDGQKLFIADGGNDRILVYNEIPTENGQPADIIIGQVNDLVNHVSDETYPNDIASSAAIRTPISLAWDGLNLYASDPFNRRIMVFTMAEQTIPNSGIRNAASIEVFAQGGITLSGEGTEGDVVSVTIQDRGYAHKLSEDDTLADVAIGLAAVINGEGGDPDVIAFPNPDFASVVLIARVGGAAGNEITLETETSEDATIFSVTTGDNLEGGDEATQVAPGMIVSIFGNNLSDTVAIPPNPAASELPRELGGVRVYIDGISAPLYYVSPTQLNAQVPVEAYDTQSMNAYVRTVHTDGTVTASNVVALPVIVANPGIFAYYGTDPRPAVATHSSSRATGVISINGVATEDIEVTVFIDDTPYMYTIQASDIPEEDDDTDTATRSANAEIARRNVRDALVELINQDPRVEAFPSSQFSKIVLRARMEGPAGNGIRFSTLTGPSGKTPEILLSSSTNALCCANIAGSLITPNNPAVAGEIISIFATGLGLIEPDEAREAQITGTVYDGPELNEPVEFVSSMAGEISSNVIHASLQRGSIGIYRIDMQLHPDTPTNFFTSIFIAQGFRVSNIATIPIVRTGPTLPLP